MTLLRVGVPIQIFLSIYAIVGLQLRGKQELIFPSTFFAEYNWLTFILEVAPTVSVATSLLLFLSQKIGPPE